MSTIAKKKGPEILSGNIPFNMIKYALPIMLTNLLQIFYNSADMFVIGNFCADKNALGSVGCTGSMINLILGIFIGLGAGVSVTLAQSIGAGDKERSSRVVHTSFLLAIILGVSVGVIGYFVSVPLLELMNTPVEFMAGASKYVQIYFCGSLANIMYNFLAGILRSRGDTVRPLLFSMAGGVVNVILNLIFVIVFNMGVEGVAIATITAQFISATLTIIYMTRLSDECRLSFSRLGIDKDALFRFIKVGLPAGIQGSLFSLSNMLLQTGYNSLGPIAVNANTAAGNVDAYIYNILNSFYHATLTFASQNFGAGNFDRVKKVGLVSVVSVTVGGLALGSLAYIFSDTLVGIFNSAPEVLEIGKLRLLYVAVPYFLCAIMETGTALLRSIGYSLNSLIITMFGSCIFRIVWVYTVFEAYKKIEVLYLVFPVSWLLTLSALFAVFFFRFRRARRAYDLK